jgi:hypothetical protein
LFPHIKYNAAHSLDIEIVNLLIDKGAVLDGNTHFETHLNKDNPKMKPIQIVRARWKGQNRENLTNSAILDYGTKIP